MFNSAFGKVKSNLKVGIEKDQEGNEILIETREDEGQEIKYQEIIGLLIAAGYFRARIKGLSSFDKVVGGITWCITNCTFEIDIDLLFQENSTIGQKIALTEKIVKVLKKMVCPSPIEPHQIQGLDFKSIFPVIQWLVKKVIETREVLGDHRRAYSISQFDKHYSIPGEKDEEQMKKVTRALKDVQLHYKPMRKFKRIGEKELLSTEEAKVSSTLLEYRKLAVVGNNEENQSKTELSVKSSKTSTTESSSTKSSSQKVGDEEDEEEKIRLVQEKVLQKLMGGMHEMSGREVEGKLASKIIGSIVGMQSEEIQEISNTFAKKKAEIEEFVSKSMLDPIQDIKDNLNKLQNELSESLKQKEKVKSQLDSILTLRKQLQQEVSEQDDLKTAIEEEFQRLDEIEEGANENDVRKIRELVLIHEKLKKEEVSFKNKCKEDHTRLKEDIAELEEQIAKSKEVENENDDLMKKQHSADYERLSKMRFSLAAKNRYSSALSRKLDEIPTRAELTQYQKRFVELYDQISQTHVETKQFYTMYNTLDDSRRYLEKEADLLDSVYDNFQAATGSSSNMLQYLKQFEKIVDGVKANKLKVEKKKQLEKVRRDELNETHHNLLEKHRQYVKAVHDFQEECRKNEILVSKLQ